MRLTANDRVAAERLSQECRDGAGDRQQREAPLLDGRAAVRRRGQGQDHGGGQHGPGPGQDEGGAELHVSQGRQGDSGQRLEGQEEVVEALVEGVEGVWPGLLGRTSEGLAGQGPSQAMDSM